MRVIVGEGFFDCLKVHQAGFGSAVAPMGSALYEPQRRLRAKRFRQIVPMLDGDAAGRRASAEIAARMAGRCWVKVIALAENRQPDQLSEEALREIITREGGQPQSC